MRSCLGPIVRGTLAAACLLLLAQPLRAQSLTSGVVEGIVRDSAGQPVHRASVSVIDAATGVSLGATTLRGGEFEILFVEPGEYELLVEAVGYRPKRVHGIPVRPAQRLAVDVSIVPTRPPVESVDEETFDPGALAGSRAGVGEWFSYPALHRLPHERRELNEIARLSSLATRNGEIEGLPTSMTGRRLDGSLFDGPRSLVTGAGAVGTDALSLTGFQTAEVVVNGMDVEVTEGSGSYLNAFTMRGSSESKLRALGMWAPVSSSKYFDSGGLSLTNLQGAILASGPLVQDSAHWALGLEARRIDRPAADAWNGSADTPLLLGAAQQAFGIDLASYTRPRAVKTEALSGFGRFDWWIAPTHLVAVRTNFTILPAASEEGGAFPGPGVSIEGRDLTASVALTSTFGEDFGNELRVGMEASRREFGPAGLGSGSAPFTLLVSSGLGFGPEPTLPTQLRRQVLRGVEAFHYRTGQHHFKAGVDGSVSTYDDNYGRRGAGEFLFGGVSELGGREGLFIQPDRAIPTADFQVPRFGVFLQDTWSPQAGVAVTGGFRWDQEKLPDGDIRSNGAWQRLTLQRNDSIDGSLSGWSPRLGVTWDVQNAHRLIVRAGAGIYRDRVAPEIIAEILTLDNRVSVQRALGALQNWPDPVIGTGLESSLGTSLSMLMPDFTAPRTTRGSAGVSFAAGNGTALHISGSVRRTEFLPRRADLNLPGPLGEDQYGRPIFGALRQQGGLLVSAPGTNRRFSEFDVVSGFDAGGSSDYWGVTVAADRMASQSVRFFGSYTFSQTTDNWLSGATGGAEAQLDPFRGSSANRNWAEGTSDFDIPHRLVLGADVMGPAGIRIAPVYRFQSGYPFTPGFRAGVDANGDGSGRNDPAFVDAGVAGVQNLLSAWDCLAENSGRFAERNACRTDAVHALDVRAALRVARFGGSVVEVHIDGLNLLESDVGIPDAALYLVDPTRDLTTDGSGNVDVPLVANPNFGKTFLRGTSGRVIRLGASVNW